MKNLRAMIACELKTFIREPMGAAFIIVFPLIMFLSTIVLQGKAVIQSTFPGNVGMTVAAAGLLGVTINLAMNRENKVLKRFQTTGLSSLTLICADYIVLCIFSILGILAQLILALLINGMFFTNYTQFIIDLIISSIYFFALAFFIGSYVKEVKSIHAITSTLFTVMMIFSGSTFPLDNMPTLTKAISSVLPLTQVNLLLQSDLIGTDYKFRVASYMYIFISTIVFLVIGKKTFKWG
ncbi:ABC transporter permease [Streptococcus oralis]|uniref:Transport permease protein n=1 Tax=Streptococcus oralis TaxID=1303 RepID=A0A7T4M149_STROR|nr:ABC transporter permease [Streptococcus oralis]QQC35125.1 ABC transporter permease [Streptococcus oralis]